MEDFIRGAIALAFCMIGVYFLRFWQRTRDRFFGLWAGAFFVLGVNRVMITALADNRETEPVLYLIRLGAFLIILYAIVDKNLRRQ